MRLCDRFGDHGLIAVLIAHCEGRSLPVDDWLMSCRVLERGVEQLMLNELVKRAAEAGLDEIRGSFVPTGRTDLVRELCRELGFRVTKAAEKGTDYCLHVREAAPLSHFAECTHGGARPIVSDSTWTRLRRLIGDFFEYDEIRLSEDSVAADVDGWDSMATVELMIEVEREFGIRFRTGEAGRARIRGRTRAADRTAPGTVRFPRIAPARP